MTPRPIAYTVTETGCHVVTSHKPGASGYVVASVDGKSQRLHRWSWEKANGIPVPDGLMIRHSCDNPPCINPAHLLPGTHADNSRDAVERGRTRRGWIDTWVPPDILTGPMELLLNTNQAGARLNLTPERVAKLCQVGLLPAQFLGSQWVIRGDDLAEFAKLERKAGRPRTKREEVPA